jgi:hypothetical protein
MTVGSHQYRHTLRRWRTLFDRPRTFAEQVEYEALGRLLDTAEATHTRAIGRVVNDYAETMALAQASNLGVFEL